MKKSLFCLLLVLPLCGFSQQLAHWGLQFGINAAPDFEDTYGGWQCSQKSIYDFGLQIRIGHRLYAATGLDCFVAKQHFSAGDSICDLKQDMLGIPAQIGFHLIDKKDWKLHVNAGLEFRTAVYLSPNDWNIERKSAEISRSHLDGIGGIGLDWGKLNLDLSYRRAFNGLLSGSTGGNNQLWISVGLLFK